jgi:antibiotic biosynthesis monooxygenase (ABM) superfamily enzyme
MFTDSEKWQAAKRELELRRRVYPGRVNSGRMTQQEADRQIAIMAEIADDYRAKMMESE